MVTGPLAPAIAGAAMGLQFDPLAATVSAVVAAALTGYPKAPSSRRWSAAGVVFTGWVIGDGIRVAGGVGTGPGALPYAAAWVLCGLGLGYVLPAVAGAAVGRSVYMGTGWLAAAAVALMVTPAIWALSGTVANAAWAVVR